MRTASSRAAFGTLLPLLGLLAAPAQAGAESAGPASPPAAEVKTGWHIVRPGDTLSGLAHRYAGSLELWHRLHELNPSIADPNLIEPGQRVEVVLDAAVGAP